MLNSYKENIINTHLATEERRPFLRAPFRVRSHLNSYPKTHSYFPDFVSYNAATQHSNNQNVTYMTVELSTGG